MTKSTEPSSTTPCTGPRSRAAEPIADSVGLGKTGAPLRGQPGVTRQPTAPPATEQLADWLDFAVPLAAAELLHTLRTVQPDKREAWLTGVAQRGGIALGSGGDAVQYATPGNPRTIRTAADLAAGIAAAVILAGADGITAWGSHWCTQRQCAHQTSPTSTMPP